MLKELDGRPEAGLLGVQNGFPTIVQYWRSSSSSRHTRATTTGGTGRHGCIQQADPRASGDVGIWHETYLVRAGEYEAIYGAMPRYGLAAAARHLPISGVRETARERAGRQESASTVT